MTLVTFALTSAIIFTLKSAVDYTFVQHDFGLFNEYFLKLTQKLTSSTSFTYSLALSTSNLVNVEVQIVHKEVYLEVE